MRWRICVVISVMYFLSTLSAPVAGALPISVSQIGPAARLVADWLTEESREQLQPGIDLLVPDVVPSPLAGDPAISSYEGFYQLYWVNPGAPPTFLSITGEFGGEIPAYSKADRNVQLTQNADVSGFPAYHDLTSIYDLVYWQIGDVVYSVESQNLESTDSLTLANALIQLNSDEQGQTAESASRISVQSSVNAGDVIEISLEGATGANLNADAGLFVDAGDSSLPVLQASTVTWQAPDVSVETDVLFVLSDPDTGDWLATANTRVFPAGQTGELALSCPDVVFSGELVEVLLSGSGYAVVDAGSGDFALGEPNTLFAPEFSGGSTLIGDVPAGGQIGLIWRAPEVSEPAVVYLFASNSDGETPGECEVTVQVASEVQAASLDVDNAPAVETSNNVIEPTAESKTNSDSEESQESALLLQDDPEPTATKKPSTKPTKTPKPYNEVVGIPTTESEGQTVIAARGSPTAIKSPTARPTATFAPTLLDDGTVAMVMSADGGTLPSPQGVTVVIPPGALAGQSTITIQPVTDSKLPTGNGVQLVRNSAFDVTVAGADGRAIEELQAPAEIRVQLDESLVEQGVRLYEVDGATLRLLPNTVIEGDELVVSLTSFTRIVAGKPVTVTATAKRNVLPFILAAVVVIIALVAMTVLAGMFRPRRQRIITNRRPTRTRHR